MNTKLFLTSLIILLGLISCNEDFSTESSEETVVEIINENPEGQASISLDNALTSNTNESNAFRTDVETLVFIRITDGADELIDTYILGIKGFSEGNFKSNLLAVDGTIEDLYLPFEYDIADVTITAYGDVGELIEGTFMVDISDGGNYETVTGSFSSIRMQ